MSRVLILLALTLWGNCARAEFCAINVTTDPPEAKVFLDGKLRGLSPLAYMHGHPVTMRVKLVKNGYKTWERDVSIGMSQVLAHHVTLEPLKRTTEKAR